MGRTHLLAAALSIGLMPTAAVAQTNVRAVFEGDLSIVDPHATPAYITRNFANLVYDTLIARNMADEYKPQMLEGWQASEDGMSYTFTLRDGLKFHDGTPVTAKDGALSIKRWGVRNVVGKLLLDHTASIDVVDEKTFTLTLSKPFAHVIRALSMGVWVMPARLAETDPSTPIKEIMGSGPFVMKIDEWVPGDRVVLEKNTAYVPRAEPADGLAGGKDVKIDRLEMRFMHDQETRFSALTRGELDFVLAPSMDYLPLAESEPDIVIDGMNGRLSKLGVVVLNHAQPPFDNPLIRKAFQYAIDSAEIMAALGVPEELARADCRSIYSCGDHSPYESNAGAEDLVEPNIEKAKQLLAEAGYNGEKVVSLHTTNIRTIEVPGTMIEDQLRRAGFNVEPMAVEWTTLMAKTSSKDPVEEGGWSFFVSHNDAIEVYDPLTNPFVNRNCASFMSGFFCSEKLRELREAFLFEADKEKSDQLVEELQREFASSANIIVWGQFTVPSLYRANLKGVLPSGYPTFWNVEKTSE